MEKITRHDVFKKHDREIVTIWNELCEQENMNLYVFDKFEFKDYCESFDTKDYAKFISSLKNFTSSDNYFFENALGFWESCRNIFDENSPIDVDEIVDYLNSKNETE